jgi:cardiolipin synthase A/B
MVLFSILLNLFIQGALIVRVLLRPNRDPPSRIAWIVVILAVPFIGIISYLLLGETNIGRSRIARLREVTARLPEFALVCEEEGEAVWSSIPENWQSVFLVARSINGFEPVGGNTAELMADSDAAIDKMVGDIDAATDHVHLLFYIWLPDRNGRKIAAAVMRAAERGVACRAMADDLGSRILIHSQLWRDMANKGVKLARALPIGNPLLRVVSGRIDLRNHRKIVVIDNRITYCGSQNCADAEFLPKAKYAPWVDTVIRFAGPVARQNQKVFVTDWMTSFDEDIRFVLEEPLEPAGGGFAAQVVATGPTMRYSAMPEMFNSLVYSARRELFITTPYYAPDASIQAALRAAASRGVDTTIIFPERNDDRAVAATSRSYYLDLLEAGVNIFEFRPGLLHAKTMTVDGELSFIGSANMDRRSFDLNYENNILFFNPQLTADLRNRQSEYLRQSRNVSLKEVEGWSAPRRLFHNMVAMVSPVL